MTKVERLQLRLTAEHQSLIEQAAQLEGMTITGFATHHLVTAAARSLEEHQVLHLRQAEAAEFLSQLAALEGSEQLPAGAERLKANFGRVKLPLGDSLAP